MNQITHRVVSHDPFTVEFISGNKVKKEVFAVPLTKREIEQNYDYIVFDEPVENELHKYKKFNNAIQAAEWVKSQQLTESEQETVFHKIISCKHTHGAYEYRPYMHPSTDKVTIQWAHMRANQMLGIEDDGC